MIGPWLIMGIGWRFCPDRMPKTESGRTCLTFQRCSGLLCRKLHLGGKQGTGNSITAASAREAFCPRVSIIIPIPPHMEYPRALDALSHLDYPKECYEIILARGSQPSRQRNMAASAAEGALLLFLDDDSLADPALLRNILKYFGERGVACVGGPNIEFDETGTIGIAINCVLASLFGDIRGCKRFAPRGKARSVGEDGLILCNMSVPKGLFQAAGGFPEQLYPNEENAFFARVLRELPEVN